MPKPIGSGPAAPNIGNPSSTSDVSTTRTSSKGKKTVKQKAEDVARPVPEGKKAQARGDRFGSGLRARAAVEMALETENDLDRLRDVIARLELPLYRLGSRLTSLDEVFMQRAAHR